LKQQNIVIERRDDGELSLLLGEWHFSSLRDVLPPS
jgi:hypothetical protein